MGTDPSRTIYVGDGSSDVHARLPSRVARRREHDRAVLGAAVCLRRVVPSSCLGGRAGAGAAGGEEPREHGRQP